MQAGMFRDKRRKKIILLAHCILNQNSISDGTADFPSQFKEAVEYVRQIIHQIEEYRKHGFDVIGLIGINRSPSCGIETTSIRDREEKGKGVFMELMVKELAAKRIPMNVTGVKTSEREESNRVVRELIAAPRENESI